MSQALAGGVHTQQHTRIDQTDCSCVNLAFRITTFMLRDHVKYLIVHHLLATPLLRISAYRWRCLLIALDDELRDATGRQHPTRGRSRGSRTNRATFLIHRSRAASQYQAALPNIHHYSDRFRVTRNELSPSAKNCSPLLALLSPPHRPKCVTPSPSASRLRSRSLV